MARPTIISRYALAIALLVGAGTASAQATAYDFERLWLDPSARGSLVLGSGETLPAGGARLGAGVGWERSPLVLTSKGLRGRGLFAADHRIGDVVKDRWTLHLTGAAALTDRLEVGLRLPFTLSQQGSDLTAQGLPGLRSSGVGPVSVMLRYGLTQQSATMPVSTAVALEGAFPISRSGDVDGSPHPYYLPRIEVGHRAERFLVAANLGAALRPHEVSFPDFDKLRHELTAGVVLATTGKPMRYEISARGAINQNGVGAHAELLGGARWGFPYGEIYALAGPGFFDAPGTPTFRALLGFALSRPEQAPAEPVAAPPPPPPAEEPPPPPPPPPAEEPPPPPPPPKAEEPPPPAPERAEIKGEKIEIHEKVFFDTGKATVQSRSYPLLDDVAKVIVANPQAGKIRIEGHTDDRGAAQLNRRLSQARAEAVRDYLVAHGVDPARLEAQGFGPDRPATSNKTAAGREANRRVEFAILGVDKS